MNYPLFLSPAELGKVIWGIGPSVVPAQTFVGEFVETFKAFPPRQKPAKFNVDDVLATMRNTTSGN